MTPRNTSRYGLGFGSGTLPATPATKAKAAATKPDPNNPFAAVGNAKNQGIADRLTEGLGAYDANRTQSGADITSFTNLFKGNTPAVQAAMGQENAAIGRFYDGGVQKDLNNMANQNQLAMNGVANQAMQEARRRQNVGLIGAASGSYANKQALAQASDIYSRSALQNANQRRSDYDYLTRMQMDLQGRRGGALDSFAKRELVPYDVRNQDLERGQNQFAFYNAQDKLNTFYGLSKPTQRRGYGLEYAQNPEYGLPQPYSDSIFDEEARKANYLSQG